MKLTQGNETRSKQFGALGAQIINGFAFAAASLLLPFSYFGPRCAICTERGKFNKTSLFDFSKDPFWDWLFYSSWYNLVIEDKNTPYQMTKLYDLNLNRLYDFIIRLSLICSDIKSDNL